MAGGVFGQAPLRLVVEASDWRSTMLMLAAGGFALALSAWLCVRDRRRGEGGIARVLSGLGVVVRHRQTWFIALAGLGSTAPLLGFAGLWGVPFLETAYGLQRTSAAAITSLMIAGWGVGAPLFGWLSDHVGRRRAPLLAGMLLETAALAALIHAPGLPLALLGGLSFAVGFFGATQITCFALVRENHPPELSGTGIGFLNGMVTGTGALFQPLIGFLLDLAWTGEMVAGTRVYDTDAYRAALGVLVAVCLAGVLCVLPVRETWCRPAAAPPPA
ncbi:MAG: MFS transporter [Alphaproteobacteria bacterium]|nr:MAG: MFS transporter [Alphaproteobacteria bacterium]